jgi:1,6-anhydro-N-acetylmuramate kinase
MNRTPVDHARILALAQEGLSRRKIAALVGCHYNTVHHVLNPNAYTQHLDKNIARRRRKGENHAET